MDSDDPGVRFEGFNSRPPDLEVVFNSSKGSIGVKNEVHPKVVETPLIADLSSMAIHKSHRRPSVNLISSNAAGIGKPNWKLDSNNRRSRKPARAVPMEAEEYNGEATEEGSEMGTDAEGICESEGGSHAEINPSGIEVGVPFVPDVIVPSGNTALLSKNWEGFSPSSDCISPGSEMKEVVNEMLLSNPNVIISNVDSKVVKPVYVDVGTTSVNNKQHAYSSMDTDAGSNFVPGVVFKFLHDIKLNAEIAGNGSNEQMEDMSNMSEFDYLHKKDHWNEAGNVITGKEEESTVGNEKQWNIMVEMTGDVNNKAMGNKGNVINSINLEPSILGDALKGRNAMESSKNDGVEVCTDTVEGVNGQKNQSYAGILNGRTHKGKLQIKFVPSPAGLEDSPAVLPIENLKKASLPFMYTLYGYMLDKKVAFPVLSAEVRKMWRNVGLEDIFMNSKGFIFFKFSNEQGMRQVLDGSPWLIFNSFPIYIQRWRPGLALN